MLKLWASSLLVYDFVVLRCSGYATLIKIPVRHDGQFKF
jgi:hypothetical protein